MGPFKLQISNGIKELHFKILHRIINLNKLLYRKKIVSSPRCYFCSLYEETIEHLFCDCLVVKSFWSSCKQLLVTFGIDFDVSTSSILLPKTHGILIENDTLNAFILFVKMFIYKSRCSDQSLNINALKQYIYSFYSPFVHSNLNSKLNDYEIRIIEICLDIKAYNTV